MAEKWNTYLSYRLEMMAFAMSKKSYTGEMVRNNKKVILTISDDSLADIVKKCGTSTGRNIDKVSEFKIDMEKIDDSDIEIPCGISVAVLLSLSEYIEVGDHYLYICNVESVYGNNEGNTLFAFNGYALIDKVNK